MPLNIRPSQDSDSEALIALIWSCWSQHPGIRMDVDAEMPELRAPATYYNGALWVAKSGDTITGMIATRPLDPKTWEICRLYTNPAHHGSGLGHALLDQAEHHAIGAGAERLALFSDTRFERAHRFYEKRSYLRQGPIRVLNDISNSLEYGYAKPVNGIETLDIAAATAAIPRLTDLLIACVNAGASLGFLAPVAPEKAKAFWQTAATSAGTGKRVIIAAWRNATLVAIGSLDMATPETQPHRADVQKIMVDPSARRTGLGRQILRHLELEAVKWGRTLLTLDTRAGDPGEALYRSEGWQEAGRIPGMTRDAGNTSHTTVFFWKQSSA